MGSGRSRDDAHVQPRAQAGGALPPALERGDVEIHGRVELHEGAKPYAGTPVVMPQPRGGEVVAASPRER